MRQKLTLRNKWAWAKRKDRMALGHPVLFDQVPALDAPGKVRVQAAFLTLSMARLKRAEIGANASL